MLLICRGRHRTIEEIDHKKIVSNLKNNMALNLLKHYDNKIRIPQYLNLHNR